ncbi:unnamed protein product [Phaeothamnion confervicola]
MEEQHTEVSHGLKEHLAVLRKQLMECVDVVTVLEKQPLSGSVTVHLGGPYFATRTPPQAAAVVRRRIGIVDAQVRGLEETYGLPSENALSEALSSSNNSPLPPLVDSQSTSASAGVAGSRHGENISDERPPRGAAVVAESEPASAPTADTSASLGDRSGGTAVGGSGSGVSGGHETMDLDALAAGMVDLRGGVGGDGDGGGIDSGGGSGIFEIREFLDEDGVEVKSEAVDLGRILMASPQAADKLYGTETAGSTAMGGASAETGVAAAATTSMTVSATAGTPSGASSGSGRGSSGGSGGGSDGSDNSAVDGTGAVSAAAAAAGPPELSRPPLGAFLDDLERQEAQEEKEERRAAKRGGLAGDAWGRGFLTSGKKDKKKTAAAAGAGKAAAATDASRSPPPPAAETDAKGVRWAAPLKGVEAAGPTGGAVAVAAPAPARGKASGGGDGAKEEEAFTGRVRERVAVVTAVAAAGPMATRAPAAKVASLQAAEAAAAAAGGAAEHEGAPEAPPPRVSRFKARRQGLAEDNW